MNEQHNRFIAFEGIDGSGKTTQLILLQNALEKQGYQVLCTREPGGTVLGESVRNILLNKEMNIAPLTESLLFAASRIQHIQEVIMPALQAGTVVLCDRYIASTIAYQGYGRGIPLAWLQSLYALPMTIPLPGMTVLLDIEPVPGMKRLKDLKDRLEAESIAFFQRVRQGYLTWAAQEKNCIIIPAEQEVQAIHGSILKQADAMLGGFL